MVEIYKPSKPLRSGSQGMIVVPIIRANGYGGRKFPYAVATLWNSTDFEKIEVSTFY